MEYPAQLQATYDRAERRKRFLQQLLEQSVTPEQTQVVSGRAVPYSPVQGLTKIAQAMLAKKGLEKAEAAQSDVANQYNTGTQSAVQKVMEQMQGRPEQPLPQGQYGPPGPPMEPDLTGAAMTAATDPYLQNNKGAQSVINAMMKSKMGGSNPYFRFLPTADGFVVGDTRTGKIYETDDPFIRAQDDPELKRELSAASTRGKKDVEKEFNKPKAEMEIESSQKKTEMLDDLIDDAKSQASYFTTGLLGQTTKAIGGTPAHNLAQNLNTIKANVGFDRLQEMRNNSPTGGALGQVSEMENKLLQAVWGALEQSQSKEQFIENLERVRTQVKDSWKRINQAYEKDYGVPYKAGYEAGPEPEAKTKRLRFDAQGNMID